MPSARIVGAVDILEDGQLCFSAGLPRLSPNQFRLDRFEEGFVRRVIIAVAFAAHGYLEAVLTQQFLIIVRTLLATPVRVVNAALGRRCRRATAILNARIAKSRFMR